MYTYMATQLAGFFSSLLLIALPPIHYYNYPFSSIHSPT